MRAPSRRTAGAGRTTADGSGGAGTTTAPTCTATAAIVWEARRRQQRSKGSCWWSWRPSRPRGTGTTAAQRTTAAGCSSAPTQLLAPSAGTSSATALTPLKPWWPHKPAMFSRSRSAQARAASATSAACPRTAAGCRTAWRRPPGPRCAGTSSATAARMLTAWVIRSMPPRTSPACTAASTTAARWSTASWSTLVWRSAGRSTALEAAMTWQQPLTTLRSCRRLRLAFAVS
mmetsp:Transcript_40526/g.103793  ORF Transcript_40526/g.103793 Transcript_40526/m.103793 type:complete len:231 (-) Transcript_40526:307-999(-)